MGNSAGASVAGSVEGSVEGGGAVYGKRQATPTLEIKWGDRVVASPGARKRGTEVRIGRYRSRKAACDAERPAPQGVARTVFASATRSSVHVDAKADVGRLTAMGNPGRWHSNISAFETLAS